MNIDEPAGDSSRDSASPRDHTDSPTLPDPVPARISEGSGPRQEVLNFRILRSLRQVTQAIDLHSRHLAQVYSITGPQLVCLLAIADEGPITVSELAQRVYLSPSTVVGIVDRLEREKFVVRERGQVDRRVVFITVTQAGEDFLKKSPSPIQEQLEARLQDLPLDEQMQIAASLEKVAELMGAERIDAAPILQSGDLTGDAEV